jgi:hypothetical protein
MTFRGVVKNGVVIVDDAAGLREGDVVDIAPVKRVKSSGKGLRGKSAEKKRAAKMSDPLPGFGMWRDRPEWKGMTGAQIAAELRRGTFRRKARS